MENCCSDLSFKLGTSYNILACSKSAMEILETGVKYVQSKPLREKCQHSSFSDPYFTAFGLNTNTKRYK